MEVYTVEVDVDDGHDLDRLLGKLWRYGFVKEERYIWGVDQWNRPKRVKGCFLVYVRRAKRQPFKAMITQENNHTASKITAAPISDLL